MNSLFIKFKEICESYVSFTLLKLNGYYLNLRKIYRLISVKINEFFENSLSLQNLPIKGNFIIKQNKILTPLEFVSSIISSGNNKSRFYSPINSLLPVFMSGSVFILLITMVAIFFRENRLDQKNWFFIFCVIFFFLCLFLWFSMFWTEKKLGKHLDIIRHNIIFGFYLFIFTEGLCFMALFWTFLHSTLAASVHVGVFNPGEGIVNFYISEAFHLRKHWDIHCFSTCGTFSEYLLHSSTDVSNKELYSFDNEKVHVNLYDSGSLINPWGLPFINTLILLSSAASLNASHCFTLLSKYFKSLIWLFVTIFFGLLFVFMQFKEYKNCVLNYNDGIYASCFFGLTGLHGIHVMLGIIALSICFFNLLINNYSPNFHQSFYFSIFYWHFVDVIWILVWLIIYLWPGSYFFTDFYLTCCEPHFFVHNMSVFYFLNCMDYNIWFNFFKIDDYIYEKKCDSINLFNFFNKKLKISAYFFINIELINLILCFNIDILEYKNRIKLLVFYLKSENFNQVLNLLFIEDFYCVYNLKRKFFNFNEFKNNIQVFCTFLNEMHYELYSNSVCPVFDDINNKFFRFIFFLFLQLNELFLARYGLNLESRIFFFVKYVHLTYFFSPWYFNCV